MNRRSSVLRRAVQALVALMLACSALTLSPLASAALADACSTAGTCTPQQLATQLADDTVTVADDCIGTVQASGTSCADAEQSINGASSQACGTNATCNEVLVIANAIVGLASNASNCSGTDCGGVQQAAEQVGNFAARTAQNCAQGTDPTCGAVTTDGVPVPTIVGQLLADAVDTLSFCLDATCGSLVQAVEDELSFIESMLANLTTGPVAVSVPEPNLDDPTGEQEAVVAAPPTTDDITIPATKINFATVATDFVAGEASSEELQAAAALLSSSTGIPTSDITDQIESTCCGGTQNPPSATTPATQQPQTKNYYCGPGTAYAILQPKRSTSAYSSSDSLSQGTLAGSRYLQTEANHGTNWSATASSNPMVVGLNRWLYAKSSGWYIPTHAPGSSYQSYLKADISGGHAVADNVVEPANGPHLPGHPVSKTIYHWVAGYGYSNYGGSSYIADPAGQSSAVSWGSGVQRTYSVSSNLMVQLDSSHGMVW
jgi:hypothetical protein